MKNEIAPSESITHNMQIWKDIDTGKFKLIDPNGTMYKCDQQGFKKGNFLPKITGFQNYRFRVKESIGDRVNNYDEYSLFALQDNMYLPREIDQELEKERSKFHVKHTNKMNKFH